jgi:phthalate 4,5-dioxygenase reductase subunit
MDSAPEDFGPDMLSLRIERKAEIAEGIFLFELVPTVPGDLPAFAAGSHVLVEAPNGMARRYSLCNAPSERSRYVIAVKREDDGQGGSLSMVGDTGEGDTLKLSTPTNYFALASDAKSHLLIAGGIGITPILAMARHLLMTAGDFKLIYCSRSPETTAFLDEIADPAFAGRVHVHHDYGDRSRSLDIASLVAARPEDAHVYCCGPRPLMQAVREATKHWPFAAVHFEDFGTSPIENPTGEQPFLIKLMKSGKTLEVPSKMTILETLRRHGIAVPSSCESGTCGACRTRLLDGVADHRDYVLDEDEHESNIMICVSRARSKTLALDI